MLNISRNTIDLWLKQREATGSVTAKRQYRRGPQPKIADWEQFRAFAQQHGHLTQQDMAERWVERISDRTIGKALKRIGLTRKKKRMATGNGTKPSAKQTREQLQQYAPEQVVYIDEAGADNNEEYAYGWCASCERFNALKLGHRTERVNLIAGWCNREVLAPMTFKGSCHTDLVEAWVEQWLVPQLQPGQLVVIDHASFHKSAAMREFIKQAGCTLLFLPPYSPDLNKIEKFWARLKHYLRKTLNQDREFLGCRG